MYLWQKNGYSWVTFSYLFMYVCMSIVGHTYEYWKGQSRVSVRLSILHWGHKVDMSRAFSSRIIGTTCHHVRCIDHIWYCNSRYIKNKVQSINSLLIQLCWNNQFQNSFKITSCEYIYTQRSWAVSGKK